MYRIIQDNHVVAICDRFRWVRMMDGVRYRNGGPIV